MRFPWLLGICLACDDSPPTTPPAEPFVVPEVSRGRTEDRFERGVGSWFGAVESPLVVTPDAIRLRGLTLVPLIDGELRPADVTTDGVIGALAAIDVPHSETAGPAVAIHPAIPYRTVYAILETLRRAPHHHVDLHARREGRPVSVGVWLPTPRSGPREVEQELLLTTTLAPEGLFVAGTGGALAPGCERITTEPEATIPRRSGRLDLEAYTRCLVRVKQTFPDEVVLRVSAAPETSFSELVAVLAASKSTEREELFPDVVPLAPRARPHATRDTSTDDARMHQSETHDAP